MVQVVLVDDHTMVREGLRALLTLYEDLELVGEVANGIEAVRLVEELRPHVVVMDINMRVMNGVDATQYIKSRWSQTTVVGISANTDDENSGVMKKSRATRLISKDKADEQLYDAIREVIG